MGDLIRAWLAARPFIPFRLSMTGGSSQDVTEPDLAVVEGDDIVKVFYRSPGCPNGRDLKSVVSVPHVVLIEDVDDGPILVVVGS